MVTAVSNDNIPIRSQGKSLGSIQGTSQGVDKGQERASGVKDLNPGVAPVCHQYVVLAVDGDAGWCIELTVALAVGAEAELELAGRVKNLKLSEL